MTMSVQIKPVEQRLYARMAEGQFQFSELQAIAIKHGGSWHMADRLIQKRRRAGEIAYERGGRYFFWHEVKP